MFLSKATWLSLVDYGKSENTVPQLPCPSCQKIELQLEEDTIQHRELRKQFDSSLVKKPSDGAGLLESFVKFTETVIEITSHRSQFIAFLRCNHCGDPVSVLGKTKCLDKSKGPVLLKFVSFSPALRLFELKSAYPKPVISELEKSFATFFSDPSAAGSRVRTSIEVLLDEQGVQKFRITKDGEIQQNKDGGQVKLPLGDRLKLFSESDPELGTMLGAVKALGNEATHGADLQSEDLLDAYDLVEHVLVELYVTRPHRTTLLAQSADLKQKYR